MRLLSPSGEVRERSAAVMAAKKALEAQQEQEKKRARRRKSEFVMNFGLTYRACRSSTCCRSTFCCDGYADDERFKED